MMHFYYVKADLFGVPRGRVERFADHKAAQFVREGAIEPYDERKHGKLPGAQDARAFAEAREAAK